MQGFEFPTEPHSRRHAPAGYRDYESYRDWLRDEFVFRCVYCLHREQWYDPGAVFHVDHLVPVAKYRHRESAYANLVYACARCNTAKCDILGIPDPCAIAFGECVAILNTGRVQACNEAGRSLVRKLKLNNPKSVQHRRRWMQILTALQSSEPELYRQCMSFPDDLPDLRRKKAPQNQKPKSVHECYFALRERDELPETY